MQQLSHPIQREAAICGGAPMDFAEAWSSLFFHVRDQVLDLATERGKTAMPLLLLFELFMRWKLCRMPEHDFAKA
jgi:hypothetical protein